MELSVALSSFLNHYKCLIVIQMLYSPHLLTGFPRLQASWSHWQMDTTDPQHKAAEFLTNGLELSTRTTYTAGQQRLANFCWEISVTPMSASEESLILFATHLAASNIAHTTIKVHISTIWHLHVMVGLHKKFNTKLTP